MAPELNPADILSYDSLNLQKGLVAWWLCLPGQMGGIRWYDHIRGRVGTLTNIASPPTSSSGWNISSRQGGYGRITFDGSNDYISIPHSADISAFTQMSLFLWVHTKGLVSTSIRQIVGKQMFLDEYRLMVASYEDGFTANIYSSTTEYTATFTGEAARIRDVWAHTGFTWDGATLRIYFNGNEKASTAAAIAMNGTTNTLDIGRNNIGNYYTDCSVDDFRLYNRSLSSSEVATLYSESRLGYPSLFDEESDLFFAAPAAAAGDALPQAWMQYRARRVA